MMPGRFGEAKPQFSSGMALAEGRFELQEFKSEISNVKF